MIGTTNASSWRFKFRQTDRAGSREQVATDLTPVPVSTPQLVLFGNIAPGWEVVQPLLVAIERDGDLWVVSDDIFAVYGDGETEIRVLEDYKASLIDYYQLVAARANNNSHMQALLQNLQTYLYTTTD